MKTRQIKREMVYFFNTQFVYFSENNKIFRARRKVSTTRRPTCKESCIMVNIMAETITPYEKLGIGILKTLKDAQLPCYALR